MLNKAFRYCFMVLFVGWIVAVPALIALSKAGVDMPAWLELGKGRTYLEGRTLSSMPAATLDAVLDGTFQTGLEDYVSDVVPLREKAVMLNAAKDRVGISLASELFGYKAYPTFYGSGFCYIPQIDSVMQTIGTATPSSKLSLERAAGSISQVALRHESMPVVLCYVDAARASDANPTASLVSKPLTSSMIISCLEDGLSEQVEFISCIIDDCETLVNDYYRNDHHWKTPYAFDAYQACVSALDSSAYAIATQGEIVYDEPPFYGASSRAGLMETQEPERIVDVAYDSPDYYVLYNHTAGDGRLLVHTDAYENGSYSQERFANRYSEYFHGDPEILIISTQPIDVEGFEDSLSDKAVLILVGDSFTNPLERFFALNYDVVVVADPRYSSLALDEIIRRYHGDALLFMVCSNTLSNSRFTTFVDG